MTKNTMRAISQDTLGEPDVLQEVELERPEPGGGQILVAVHAAGVNPTDWMHRRLGLHLGEPPFTLGWDVSGVVEATGFGVTLFQPGDEVFGMLPYPHGVGSHAEWVTAPTRAFARKPENVDHVQAAPFERPDGTVATARIAVETPEANGPVSTFPSPSVSVSRGSPASSAPSPFASRRKRSDEGAKAPVELRARFRVSAAEPRFVAVWAKTARPGEIEVLVRSGSSRSRAGASSSH